MKETINEQIQILDWKDVREILRKGDQELFQIIDDISPNKQFKFIKVRYPYGTTILENDTLFMPDKPNVTTPLSFAELPETLKQELNYMNGLPFGIITENTMEIFKEYSDKVFSVELSGPHRGMALGIFDFFGLATVYSVTAGARSIFMLPQISEARYHKRVMNKYDVNCYPPKNIFKHWHVFKSLYASGNLHTKWETEIIYLGKKWFDHANDKSPEWRAFKSYITQKGFDHSSFGRTQVLLNLVWEKMVSVMKEEGLKPDPYTIDTLKHLSYIFLGALPGSRPAINNYAGPLLELQEIYLDTYGLTQIPTIMIPQHFSFEKNIPVYYSMQNPTFLSSTPMLRKMDTIIQEMNSLSTIKEFFISRLAEIGNIKINNRYLSDILRKMQLNYYHSEMYSYGKNIRPTKEIPESDKDYLFSSVEKKGLVFAENGSFIKGCVKISKGS